MNYLRHQSGLEQMHRYLMHKGFPYHSVSVIYRHQDLGLHVIFAEKVKEMVTDEIADYIKSANFGFSFVKN